MSAHTPGPWGKQGRYIEALPRRAEANGGWSLAEVVGPDAIPNARLIAAAPALLAHLEVMMSVHCPQPGPECGACEHARGLVAAARGER